MNQPHQSWISTATAAQMTGYTPQHFRLKFSNILPNRRFPGGNRKWLKSAVAALMGESKSQPSAA